MKSIFLAPIPRRTLYERIGGKNAIYNVIETALKMCEKNTQLSKVLGGKSFNIKRVTSGMTQYVSCLFGGPQSYNGPTLSNAHAPARRRGLKPKFFNEVMGFVETIFRELDIRKNKIFFIFIFILCDF